MPTLRPRPEPSPSTSKLPFRSRIQKTKSRKEKCTHPELVTTSSPHAEVVNYTPKLPLSNTVQTQSFDGTSAKTKNKQLTTNVTPADHETFPLPLVLPDDDLSLKPNDPGQSLLSWTRSMRNRPVTSGRSTIYIVSPPEVDDEVKFVGDWCTPHPAVTRSRKPKSKSSRSSKAEAETKVQQPSVDDIAEYTRAFYHPLPVKVLPPSTLKFVSWSERDTSALRSSSMSYDHDTDHINTNTNPSTARPLIGLQTSRKIIGITTRARLAQSDTDGDRDNAIAIPYTHQLSLNPLIDTCISILPNDAYALILLTHHDLYEDEDDEFICGRAYGGSRVAVVSTARYHPDLDSEIGLEKESDHGTWPDSHCSLFVDRMCGVKPRKRKRDDDNNDDDQQQQQQQHTNGQNDDNDGNSDDEEKKRPSPLRSAILATQTSPHPNTTTKNTNTRSNPNSNPNPNLNLNVRNSTYLYRLVRTTTHELGHVFGIAHCTYHACIMQGSASLLEDHRQPPYLCPVDLAKVLTATGCRGEVEWLKAMHGVCASFERKIKGDGDGDAGGGGGPFAAFRAWIQERLRSLDLES